MSIQCHLNYNQIQYLRINPKACSELLKYL